jgi:hypothetical protein
MRASVLVAAGAVMALAAGCQGSPSPTTVMPTPSRAASNVVSGGDARSGLATISAGQTVRLSLGEYNASIGDSWGVLTNSVEGVVVAEIGSEPLEVNPPPGAPSRYYLELGGRNPGKTVVELRYCYRSALAADCDQGPHSGVAYTNVKVAVTVS